MTKKSLWWILAFSLLIFSLNVNITGSAPSTKLSVIFTDTATTYLVNAAKGPLTSVTFDLVVSGVYDLYGYGLRIRWAGPILNVTSVVAGPFLTSGGGTTFPIFKWYNAPDPAGNTDFMTLGDTILAPHPVGVTGTGVIATVTFLVEEYGESAFYIYESQLYDSQKDAILHDIEDGYFANETWASKGYPGDCDGDYDVDLTDLMIIARAMGTDPSYPAGTGWNEWNPDADLNNDLRVDVFDLVTVGVNYGQPLYT